MRVGVIGTGFGSRVVATTFRQIGCDVVDVVSARDHSGAEGLCRSRLDLVSVHSPPFLHATHVRMALDQGHAVLCDKPFGISGHESASLAADAQAAGVVNLVNFEFRQQPARQKMKELVAGGAIGEPEHLLYSAHVAGSRVPLRPYGWLFDRSLGGGWIGAFGSHAIDMMRWLLGDVTAAGAKTWVTVPERPDGAGALRSCDAEDSFCGWFEFESGATATLDTSFTSSVSLPPRITLTGSEGTIENTADARVVLRGADGSREEFTFEPSPGDMHQTAMERWAAIVRTAVMERAQVSPSFADGVACAIVMDQLRVEPPLVVGAARRTE
jgi:predicted dehydrogenase